MTAFVALLRGINVGKAKRVPMEELRILLAELGHTEVVTLLNSGNAVFRAARGTPLKHAADIAAAIAARLGVEVPVIVKSASEFMTIVAENPLAGKVFDPARFLIAFTQDAQALTALAAVTPLVIKPEVFRIGKSAAYLYCTHGILESKAAATLLGKRGSAVTTRNWATVHKLHTLLMERDG